LPKVYLGVGSNQGDRLHHCRDALLRLKESGDVRLIRVSSAYETEPVGEDFEGWFINAVAEAETDLDPVSLLQKLKRIEEEMGRSGRTITPNRPIDLDLLLYGDLLLESETLTLPHPHLHQRRFVLEPLSELAPELVHPRLGKTMEALLKDLSDPNQVRRMRGLLWGSFSA
jgi:2-amino-4-hydroxy-6-hydroxymethyldihydropteridine diphosphokinase